MQINFNKEEAEFVIEALKAVNLLPDEKVRKMVDKLTKRIERAKTPIKPRSAKNKGMDWQKEICSLISELTGIEYDQKNDDCLIHSRESGLSGTDVVLRGEAKEKFPYSVECKNCKTLSIPDWIRQADNNADNGNWLLFVKSPVLESKKIVVMSLDQFKDMYLKHSKESEK